MLANACCTSHRWYGHSRRRAERWPLCAPLATVGPLAHRCSPPLRPPLQFPLALETLRDPEIRADKLYAHNRTSSLCVIITAGYFLYDVYICTVR